MILHVLIAMVAGWLQRHQQQVISYLHRGKSCAQSPHSVVAGFASPTPNGAALRRWPTRSDARVSKRWQPSSRRTPSCAGTSD